MTEPTTAGAPKPFPIELPAQDKAIVATAVELYAKHLQSLAKAADGMNRDAERDAYDTEANGYLAEVAVPLRENKADPVHVHHLPAIRRGLDYFITLTQAPKGTLTSIGQTQMVTDLDDLASHVQEHIVPVFDEQTALPLDPPAPSTDG